MDSGWNSAATANLVEDLQAAKLRMMNMGLPPEPMIFPPITRRPIPRSQSSHDPRYLSFWGVDHPDQTPGERSRAQCVRAREKLHAWIRLPEWLRGRG